MGPSGIQRLVEALRSDPDDPRHWVALTRVLYSLGDWEGARKVIDKAHAAAIDHPQLMAMRQAMQGAPGGRKIFCIGRNKTGTTSLEAALRTLGFRLGMQRRGELLRRDWGKRDFTRIIELCRTADAFQDVPFSFNDTYRALDEAFPGSKFILTVRDTPEQWYESVMGFYARLGSKGRLPTAEEFKALGYRYKGDYWESEQLNHGVDETTLYDRERYVAAYLAHNNQVAAHFRERPGDLLVLNVAEPAAMEKLCLFLGVPYLGQPMPHLNRTPTAHANRPAPESTK